MPVGRELILMSSATIHRLGVLSDTHGNLANTRKATALFQLHQVDVLIHCGDIGSPEIPPLLSAWPTHYVLGNVDGSGRDICAAIRAVGHTCHGRFGTVRVGGRRIAFLHGDDQRRFHEAIHDSAWDLVCYGHTHVAEYRLEGSVRVLNPGAVHRGFPPQVAIVDLAAWDVTAATLV